MRRQDGKLLVILILCSPMMVETKKNYKRFTPLWQMECELGLITDPSCPVHGGWTPWGTWGPCQGLCDDVGSRHRRRECTNPAPSFDGAPCTGDEEQTQVCYLTNCTVEDFRKLIAGDTSRMKALHHLEAVPSLMERCLQMECPFEAIEAALTVDNTWQLDPESLWNALQCVRRNLGCPVAGEWGVWGDWSPCGARCGQGFRWRLRRCDTPPPTDANLVCRGIPFEADVCIGDQCAISSLDSTGSWGEWSSWSPCTEKCGPGIRRRRRICHETTTPHASGTWGTHCRGQHDQVEICENSKCDLDGGWSGWSGWGPCSQNCGAGKQSRARSCTRPIPTGAGERCAGARIEVGSCHLAPCEGFSHQVAVFRGESFLRYDLSNKRASLFHFYIRFMPISPNGILVRRAAGTDSHVRLSLQKWHVCLDVCSNGQTCCLTPFCSHSSIEPAAWHTALVSVTRECALLRLDNAHDTLKRSWNCEPDLPDNKLNIYVGENYQGQIQELILNFIPLKLTMNRDRRSSNSDFSPIIASNIAYEKSSTAEAYLRIKNDHYLRLPCYENQNEWKLELTLKPKTEMGTILFLKNDHNDNWLHVDLQNMRLKIKLVLGEFRSERSSTIECPPKKWLDITITKKQETNAIEATINAGERLHVLFQEEIITKKPVNELSNITKTKKGVNQKTTTKKPSKIFALCTDEFFIGGVPNDILLQMGQEEFTPFSGILASVKINKEYLDLHDYSLERYKDNKIQVSSRTASVSGSYHETAWGKSNHLNLTCIHARSARVPHSARWLFLDTSVNDALRDKNLKTTDDGIILRLVASANNDLKGFYTCRAHINRRTRNLVTYGVLGKTQYKLHSPDITTVIACFTTLSLIFVTLIWLVVEGIQDLRSGYGFYRDAHLTPEEEAEEVCNYIDQNTKLVGKESDIEFAKQRTRRIGKRLGASRTSFGAQEPQGLMEESLKSAQMGLRELDRLPTLPEVQSASIETSYDIDNFEPSNVSSPRQCSVTTARTREPPSPFELISPRHLCSKLLTSKRKVKSNSSASVKSRSSHSSRHSTGTRAVPFTPARAQVQRVLQKFYELKRDDFDEG